MLYQLSYRPTDLVVSGETAWSFQFIKLSALKLPAPRADTYIVSTTQQLPDEPIRSKGHATILAAGFPELPATLRDISAAGIGVVAGSLVSPGTPVDIHIHDHAAHGIVQSCRAEGSEFYIGIVLAA